MFLILYYLFPDAKTETLLENLNDEKKDLRAKLVSLRNGKEKLLTEKCNDERQIDRRELELRQLQVKLEGMSKGKDIV
jgi:peptidoglycan hydrolase CwlO-like protein